MEKINKGLFWSIIASESIHIFCCGLPTLFSILSLLAGFGLITTMPVFIDHLHHVIHGYEIPMIITSGIILALGWGLYTYSRMINCQTDGGCSHSKSCEPKKDRTRHFMMIATVLFIGNVAVYFVFHRGLEINLPSQGQVQYHAGHEHGHDHH